MTKTLSRDELAKKISNAARITGEFTLRSGTTSTVYFDKYRFESDPEILAEIAQHLAELVPDGTTRLVGLEMGGIPLATAISMATGMPENSIGPLLSRARGKLRRSVPENT